MTSKQLFDNYNKGLIQKLIPLKTDPIIGKITDPNDQIFNKSFEEIRQEVILEILDQQEFLTELETIKHNLKIE